MTYFSGKIKDEIIGQYKESPVLISFIESLLKEADLIEIEYQKLMNKRYLIEANGRQLDILGEILGISRVVVDFIEDVYFGFNEDPTAKSFGDLNDPAIGGRFVSADENPVTSRKLNDDEYRGLLFAKISKNNSSITPDEVLAITSGVLSIVIQGGENIPVKINEMLNASFEIEIGALLSGDEQAYIAELDLIPRPAGVKIEYLYVAAPNTLLTNEGLTMFFQNGTIMEIQ